VTRAAPAVSVGLAVRSAEHVVGPCIESVLAQDFTDLELVVCDNVSDDGTVSVVQGYARTDPRIRLSVNETNVGSQANMNRVFDLARGEFFRWISSDDWLEPGYLSTCLAALEESDRSIGVTTYFTIHTAEGSSRYEEYTGEFPTSADPARRFERMLWFFQAGDAKYDPIYGLYRRAALARTPRLRASEQADWLLCAQLALMGPIAHVKQRLAHRTRSYSLEPDLVAWRRRLDAVHAEELRSSWRRLHRDLLDLALSASLTDEQVRRCKRALRRFMVKEAVRRGRQSTIRTRDRLLRN
jgi:glycosyltransferase involved in cell wall biosynthesis